MAVIPFTMLCDVHVTNWLDSLYFSINIFSHSMTFFFIQTRSNTHKTAPYIIISVSHLKHEAEINNVDWECPMQLLYFPSLCSEAGGTGERT